MLNFLEMVNFTNTQNNSMYSNESSPKYTWLCLVILEVFVFSKSMLICISPHTINLFKLTNMKKRLFQISRYSHVKLNRTPRNTRYRSKKVTTSNRLFLEGAELQLTANPNALHFFLTINNQRAAL